MERVSPVELPTSNSFVGGPSNRQPSPMTHRRMSSAGDNYYEDVDPRFAATDPRPPTSNGGANMIPASLTPGPPQQGVSPGDSNGSYEDLQEGARSPAASEASHFTSVSQRGVNPNWRPVPNDMMNMPPPGAMMGRRPVPPSQQQQNVLFDNNPDFNLPGVGPGRSRGGGMQGGPNMMRGGGGMGGMMPPQHPPRVPSAQSSVLGPYAGIGNAGRYPTP